MPELNPTLYQVLTSTALVQGVYQGAVRIATLREHGDLGLGTFEELDGEMVIVDGLRPGRGPRPIAIGKNNNHGYQAIGSRRKPSRRRTMSALN
jgi:hypothetical protein